MILPLLARQHFIISKQNQQRYDIHEGSSLVEVTGFFRKKMDKMHLWNEDVELRSLTLGR